MTWVDDARHAWRAHCDHQAAGQAIDLQEAKAALLRRVQVIVGKSIGTPEVVPTPAADLADATSLWLLALLPQARQLDYQVALGTLAQRTFGVPSVHAWVRDDSSLWLYAGPVDTMADLGRVLTDGYQGDNPPDARPATDNPASTAELLHDVLHALVRDVVGEVLDDRHGGGST